MSFFRRAGALIARFFTSAADPAAAPSEFKLYSKDATGVAQLFGRSSDGTIHQLTPVLSGDRYALPPTWFAENLAASSPSSPMLMQVSFTNDFRAVRAGSIVGLSTMVNPGVGGSTLTAQIAINEIPGTLTVVHTSGSNPEGGFATQAAGIDTYAAGDLISALYTTDAGFTPVGSLDLASWIQVRDDD